MFSINKHVLKEYLVHIIYKAKALIACACANGERRILQELDEKGYCVLPNFLSTEICESLINEFNAFFAIGVRLI